MIRAGGLWIEAKYDLIILDYSTIKFTVGGIFKNQRLIRVSQDYIKIINTVGGMLKMGIIFM